MDARLHKPGLDPGPEGNSNGGISPLRSLSLSSGPPSPRQLRSASRLAAVHSENQADIDHDISLLQTYINELVDLNLADGGEHSEQATTQIIDSLLGPRKARAAPHPNAAPCAQSWYFDWSTPPPQPRSR